MTEQEPGPLAGKQGSAPYSAPKLPRSVVVKRSLVGLLIVLSPVWAPIVLIAVLVGLYMGALLLTVPAEIIDREFNTHPFEPGRWESRGGTYWVELHPDGTGDIYLPGTGLPGSAASTCRPSDEPWEGAVAWEYLENREHGFDLHVVLDPQRSEECVGSGPLLVGDGYWFGEYNWDKLHYSGYDPDAADLTVRRVDN